MASRSVRCSVLRIALALLSVIFIIATILGFRFSNPLVKFIYWIASIWLGVANFLFVGACVAWLADFVLRITLHGNSHLTARPYIAGILLIAALGTALYGFLNALVIRQRRVTVRLPNLPPSWRGRTALLISDLHLGHINGASFARRIAAIARQLNPAILFIAGDLYDGSRIDPDSQAAPLWELSPPLGIFFVGGNHEAFGGAEHYEEALDPRRHSRVAQRACRRRRPPHRRCTVRQLHFPSSASRHFSKASI